MIPITQISGGTLDSVFLYTGILGALLLLATILRVKVPIFKRLFIPASLIAGVIGLILGQHGLNIIPAEVTSYWSALSGRLIVLVFAPMLMGGALPKFKKLVKVAGPQVIYSYAACFMQYAIPLLLGVFLLTPIWGVNSLFGTIVEQGWAGGHGTAGGMTAVFEELGYAEGASLSVTSATFGLVVGIIGGTILINYAVRKNLTSVLKSSTISRTDKPALIKKENQQPGSMTTINKDVIESFAFHAALLSVAIVIGWLLNYVLKAYVNFSVSWFVTAMFGGLIVQLCISRTKWGEYVDKPTLQRIQGTSLEFLVAGAIASVNIPVVIKYFIPLLIQQGIVLIMMLILLFWFCRRIFEDNWFEHGMVLWGTFTGVAATGLMLLRTVDPEMKTDVAEAFAARSPFTATLTGGGILTAITPTLVVKYGALTVGLVYLVGFVIALIIPRLVGWWYPPAKQVNQAQQMSN